MDYINLDIEVPQVTVVARDIERSSSITQGADFVSWLTGVSREAGFTGKASYKIDGALVSADRLRTENFAGQTIYVESYNSAA